MFVGEASFLATGFATYWNEVIKRLHQKGDIECFEMGSYARDDDPRCQQVPWKFYSVEPNHNDQEALNIYRSDPENQFGKWRFEDVCLDCRPDIVIDIRDFWMIDFINRSPYRDNYINIQMPTIDGEPQKDKWIDGYRQADHIFTYSKYGYNLLKQYDGINLHGLASPAADIDIFKPVEDKDSHKQKLGIHPESIIIGTVMRNQARKLYYDLIEAFSQWLNKTKRIKPDLAKKAFLYLHTSYPDVGFDIGRAIKEFKIGNKVLMTYICSECQCVYPSFFSGAMATCRNCKKTSAHPPNASHHVPRKVLADIMNMFDVYVQYSICMHPDTPVLMSDRTHKPIRNIKSGDLIVSFDGSVLPVKWCKKTKDKARTVEITTYGNTESVICTNDHPIMIYKNNKFQWMNAEDIENEYVCYPIDRTENPTSITEHDLFVYGSYIGNGGKNSPGSISFSFGYDKENTAKEIELWLDKKELTHSRSYHKKAKEFRIIVSSTKLVNDFMNKFGQRSENKHIPDSLMKISVDKQKYLIRGLFATDGCISCRRYTNQETSFIYSTVSRQLAFQTRDLLLRQNIVCSISKQIRENRQPIYHVRSQDTKLYSILLKKNKIYDYKPRHFKIVDNHLLMRVKNVEVSQYNKEVWDLSVQTKKGDMPNSRSFVTNHFVSHNCEG